MISQNVDEPSRISGKG